MIRCKVHKFGDNINTDLISPACYLELDTAGIAAHAMEGADPDFMKKMQEGDCIVAEKNFGPGSSRETAPIALKGCGVSVVIAQSFARIFYRNSINIGLPVMICEQADEINEGDELEVEPVKGTIKNLTTGKQYQCASIPENIMTIIEHGGLLGDIAYRLEKEKA
ncbi:MAG: 3-isopropylmalate dehydratase small subunit [Mogibacterium sp.]|nr:3-isopropylmalate dehydratase small subunit [Mogibacterium sp.]